MGGCREESEEESEEESNERQRELRGSQNKTKRDKKTMNILELCSTDGNVVLSKYIPFDDV